MPRQIDMEATLLMEKYYENFVGSVAPDKHSVLRTLKSILPETKPETLEPLVVSVAKDGMILTRNSLLVAKSKRDTPPPKPTPVPPAFVPETNSEAIPMPAYVRDTLNAALRRRLDG